MKIMFLIPRMGGGGAERVISILSNSFVEKGYKVHISQLINSESFYALSKQVSISGMDISIRRNNRFVAYWDQTRFFLKGLMHIKNDIKLHKPDVVIAFMRQSCIMMTLLRLFGEKTRYVCSERNDPTIHNSILRKIMRAVYKKADLFVCQSGAVSDYFSDIRKRVVIPNPIICSKHNATKVAEPKKSVVAVGRLDTQKNFKMLINSFYSTHKLYPEYVLEIYGEGPKRKELEAQINRLEAEDYIKLMGAKSDVLSHIYDSSLFVMSSDYEGFPNALAEAMSVGLPVVSTDFFTGVAKELIGENNGRLVAVGDEEAMTSAICDMLSSEEKRKVCSINNVELCKKYSVPNVLTLWEQEIIKLIKQG